MTITLNNQTPDKTASDQTSAEATRTERYAVSVEEYRKFKRNGFLVVRNLVSPSDIAELRRHTEDLMQGKLPEQNRQMSEGVMPQAGTATQGLEAPPAHLSPEEKVQYFL